MPTRKSHKTEKAFHKIRIMINVCDLNDEYKWSRHGEIRAEAHVPKGETDKESMALLANYANLLTPGAIREALQAMKENQLLDDEYEAEKAKEELAAGVPRKTHQQRRRKRGERSSSL